MDMNLLRNLVTLASLAAFLWVLWWAFAPSRKGAFEANGRLPFDAEADAEAGGKAR